MAAFALEINDCGGDIAALGWLLRLVLAQQERLLALRPRHKSIALLLVSYKTLARFLCRSNLAYLRLYEAEPRGVSYRTPESQTSCASRVRRRETVQLLA